MSHPRWLRLPDHGLALVSTDLHGNGEDFRTLRDRFLQLRTQEPETHWVILGDVVHAPDESARRRLPEVYDYPDEALAIVEGILALQDEHPGRVHFVLGNHDHGHIGGPHTHKFHPDEVEQLERQLGEAGTGRLRQLFESALLAVIAPCGVLLAHGSPGDTLLDLDDLNRIQFPRTENEGYLSRLLGDFLNCYGQRGEVTERLLAVVSRKGTPVRMVIHGHDRDPNGWFVEGGNQLCPVIFGALRPNKRCVLLKLTRQYQEVSELCDAAVLQRLYPADTDHGTSTT